MIRIKLLDYYSDQLSDAFDDAYTYGREGKHCVYLGEDGDGKETFLVSDDIVPYDLSDFLRTELEEEDGIITGSRKINTSHENEDESGNVYNVDISY